MFKASLTLILCCLMNISSYARAPYSHAEFVHLTDTEKNHYIIKTMEMVVELESKYAKEIVSTNPNHEKIKQYVQVLQKLKSLLISNAYAAALATPTSRSAKEFEKIADDFSNLLKKPEVCIYGGWISRMSLKGVKLADGTTTKRSLCLHPNHLTDGIQATKYPPETLAYATDSSCMGKNKITCNPVVFGYKKQADNTLFCVDAGVSATGVNQADNSSLYCMRAALEEKSSSDQDSVESRLGYLRKALSEKPAIFESVQQLIFKSCICVDPKNNFNRDYVKYMQPHQTCYSMMEMMAETTICEDPKFAMDTTIFQNIRDFAKDKFDRMTSAPAAVRDYYKNFVIDIQTNTPEEYTKFCGGSPPKIVEVTPPETKPEEKKVETPPKKEYLCKNTVCTAAAAAEVKEGETAAPQYSCSYEVTDKDGGAADFKETSKDISTSEPISIKLTGTIGEETVSLDCAAEVKAEEKPVEETIPTLDVAKEASGTDKYKVTAKISEPNEGWSLKWKIKNNGDFKPKEGWVTTTPKVETDINKDLAGQPEKESETKTPSTETSRDPLETIQARATVNYDVCGEISKGDKKAEKCVTIDMLNPVKAPASFGGRSSTPQPQTRIRGTSDTSAVGIK
ncbi:MAG: hypothetical protein NDI69_00605 [Bacteriovoracaceae bacterium]|nr:hypothetical protein [Bacteriovoracaceae bacterium]